MTTNGTHPIASELKIRTLEADDANRALELSRAEGWLQNARDWENLIRWSEGGAYGIEDGNTLVAVGVCCSWGNTRGRLANIITHRDYRHRGLAKVIIQTLMRTLQKRGVSVIDLDANEDVSKMYAPYGFVATHDVDLYMGTPKTAVPVLKPNGTEADIDAIINLDTQIFGAPRPLVIRDLVHGPDAKIWVDREEEQLNGYLITHRHDSFIKVGPWVHHDPTQARAMLEGVASYYQGAKIRVDTISANPHAVSIVKDLGLECFRQCQNMVLTSGGKPPLRAQAYFGIVAPTVG